MKLPLHQEMSNKEIAEVFKFIAQVLRRQEKDFYRVRAYQEAGIVIKQLPEELKQKYAKMKAKPEAFEAELEELPGIGEGIASKLVELFQTGNIKAFQKYVKDVPAGVYPLVKLYGLGFKKAIKLAKKFKLTKEETAVEKLLAAAKQGKVRGLEGFGEKSEQDLIEILEQPHQKGRIPYSEALGVARKLEQILKKVPEVSRVIFLGSLRRELATVGDIDMGMVAKELGPVKAKLEQSQLVKRVLVSGNNVIRLVLKNGWQADIRQVAADEWGSFVQHFTGSKEHNIRLRELAMRKGLSLSEHGIKDRQRGKTKKFKSEKEFYNYLGFKLIPPSERVGGEELEKYLVKD